MAGTTTGIAAPTSIFAQEPTKAAAGTGGNGFGQDAFLKLLVSQLRFQDPSEPVDNQQFLGQMAQFTSLEQMVKMNTSLDKLSGSTSKSDAVSMLGGEVTIQPMDQTLTEGETPKQITGIVDEISFVGKDIKLTVGGTQYSLDDVIKIKVPEVSNSSSILGQ